MFSTFLGGCCRFKMSADGEGGACFAAEAGQREAAGATGFPPSGEESEEPPTYLMVGRMAPDTPESSE